MPTKIIENFTGRLTRQESGDMNSGLAKYATTFGNDPFSNPSNLTWLEQPTAIAGISGLVIAARVRLESGITYVYAVTDSGNLYKIQVNKPTTVDPNYDTATYITTISTNNLWSNGDWGTSIQFYGSTEKIFVGSPKGVTKINFDGSAETFIGILGSYTASVPRPSAQFLGKTYWGNGSNILEIDSTETVTSYAKLSPGFPSGTFVRDLDVTPDGNYLQIIVSKINSPILDSVTQDTTSLSSSESYKFLWNGTDPGYTSFESYNGYALTSNTTFGGSNFTMGYDLGGAALYSGSQKIISLPNSVSPNFGAMFSTSNLLGFAAPEYVSGSASLQSSLFFYGQYDQEVPKGLFRFLRATSVSGTDVVQMPICMTVTNLFYGSAYAGYSGNVVGAAKLYFSTFETDAQANTFNKFYKFTTVPTGLGTAISGVYETQQETSFRLFRSIISKKFQVKQVRFFVSPLVANNSFKIDLIGSDGSPMSGGSKTFTVGSSPIVAGQDVVQYTPAHTPTYSVGVRITNLGSVNWTGVKLELDYEETGIL